MTAAQIRQECRKYAQKWVDTQRASFIRLGVFGRWNDPYLTMAPAYQAAIAQAFVDFLDQGYVYRGLKPVNWCIHCRTSLAEAEIEYADHKSPSVYVRFALKSDPSTIDPALAGKAVYGLIWTTTPWTLPANLAISFHPDFDYVAVNAGQVDAGQGVYLVAEQLLPAVSAAVGWEQTEILARFKGSKLDRAVFAHPFLERESLGLNGDHVTLDAGTGAVHTAPGHGMEDYIVSKRYGIEPYNPVDPAGRLYRAEGAAGELPEAILGKTVWEANPLIVEMMRENGSLLKHEEYGHSYPHCWRCHNPTIFRATEQWFISMEREGSYHGSLRERTLAAIQRVKWIPGWGEERITNMIATRPDWNISRQRVWGVPITVFTCESCQHPVTEKAILDRVVERFKVESADVWYTASATELLPPGYVCAKCGKHEFRKEMDILDVWFDSGSSHLAVLREENGLEWPSDMYLEGGDQYRGWFHSSLLIGVGLRNSAPYRETATHGWTLDAQGRAMSKSLGNTIEPNEIIERAGADILRLWVSSVAFYEDVKLSEEIEKRLVEAYRKIRNTLRYCLGNLNGFNPETDLIPPAELLEIDQWALVRAEELVEKVLDAYESYEFHRAYQALYQFCVVDLSSLYFDVLKDRLYTGKLAARRSAQTALYRIAHALIRLAAPVLVFTCEEAWCELSKAASEPDSVHLALFPARGEMSAGLDEARRKRLESWTRLAEVRERVLMSLETKRQDKFIGAPLEAHVTLRASGDLFPLLEEYQAELAALFIVSEVSIGKAPAAGEPDLTITVGRASGTKCERCWKYRPDVGSGDARYPGACAACAEALTEMGV
jgi:isoleucyl-tRNA synthetase